MDTLVELASSEEFLAGLRVGVPAMVLALVAGIFWRRSTGRPTPLAGLLIAGGTLLALAVTHSVPPTIWIGIAFLAAGGLTLNLLTVNRWRIPLAALVSIPGALLIGLATELPGPVWAPPLVVIGTVVGGALVADFDSEYRSSAWGIPLLAISVLGVLFTVPDTEEALVFAGVALPLAFLGGPMRLASLGNAGSLSAVGVFMWVAVLGGRGRETAIVGAVVSLGLLLAEPIARSLRRAQTWIRAITPSWRGAALVGILQIIIVFLTSRIAGLQASLIVSVIISTGALIGAVGVALQAPARKKRLMCH